jgi:hypothetical protein
MRRMLTRAAALGLLTVLPSAALGQSAPAAAPAPSARQVELARQIINVELKSSDLVADLVPQLQSALGQTAAQVSSVDLEKERAAIEVATKVHYPAFRDGMAAAYAANFSETELTDILKFAA